MRVREKKIKNVVENVIDVFNKNKLTVDEIIIVLGQLLIQCGYTIFYKLETDKEPEGEINVENANELFRLNDSIGTTLMKFGFDFQSVLLRKRDEEEKRKRK